MNIIITDKNQNSKDIIKNHLKDIENIDNIYCFDDLNSIDCNLKDTDIIIFDVNSDTALENIVIVDELKKKYKQLSFIAISYEINSELVSKVLKENVSEFIIKPIIPSILISSIKKIQDGKTTSKMKKAKTLCVYSNKGGVGKTSISANIAYEMSNRSEEKVCLLDLSFNFGDIATFLDITPKDNFLSLVQKVEHTNENLIYTLCEKYKDSNLYVLTFKDDSSLNNKYINPEIIAKLINSLKNFFDYIVIDSSSAIDENLVSALNCSDVIILVGMLNMASIRNMQKCFELFNNLEINSSRIKLVLNRYIENSEIKADDIKQAVGTDIFYKIPNNYLTLIDAINLGRAVSEINPHSNIAKAYQNLAREIMNIDYANLDNTKSYNHGIFNLLRRMGE